MLHSRSLKLSHFAQLKCYAFPLRHRAHQTISQPGMWASEVGGDPTPTDLPEPGGRKPSCCLCLFILCCCARPC